MKFFLLALFAVAATVASADDIEEEGGVLVLNKDNFKGAIEANEFILVEFYAPWCGHCKSLAPEYEKAAGKLKESGSAIKLAKVDATVERSLGEEYKVQGFPTLKFFRNGEAKEYNGPREADGIVAWLEKKTGPPAKDLKTAEEAEKLAEDKDVVVIGFFKDQESDDAKEFLKAASDNDEQAFAITSEQAVFDKYEAKDGAIVLLKSFDEKRNDFDGKVKAKDINKFASVNSIPLINEFSPETAAKIFGSDVKVHFLLLADKSGDAIDAQVEAMRPAAKANKGKMVFVHIDSGKDDNAQVLDFFGIKKDDCPQFVVYEMEKSAKYLAGDRKVEESDITAFVADYFDGKLKRHLKSEDLPEDWDKNAVKTLVSTNFKEVALDKAKDVFVEFYAPWCGHCKSLAPKWDKLGEHFADNDAVVIAKMDATANEIEEVSIEGFPTLKLWKKESNQVVDYNGKRELEDMIKFIETGEGGAEPDMDDDEDDEDAGHDEL